MTLLSDLLKRGYLPENLPPVFVSKDFGNFVESGQLGVDYRTRGADRTRPATYNATKRGHHRRLFSIPNPIAAADTALFLAKNWDSISEHMDKSPFSISVPKHDEVGTRSVAITPHSEIARLKSRRLATSRYIARTDIARFFPSVYTHALPWGFHGKDAAKASRSPDSPKVFFNRLDFILRQAQDGQTIGIPVGPDSSRVIAEILASAVDQEFRNHAKKESIAMLRHVDDVWIGANTRDEAERLLYIYRACLREFELDINEHKTSIVPATDDLVLAWPMELGRQLKSEFDGQMPFWNRRQRRDDMFVVLDQVFDLANKQGDDGVIKFAIRRLDEMHAWINDWDILHTFLLRCVKNYPHSIDYVARVIAWRVRVRGDVDAKLWRDVVDELLVLHGGLGNDSEVCWALWLAMELKVSLSKRATEQIWRRCGPLPIMILCDCCERKLARMDNKTDEIVGRWGRSPFSGPFWILALEAVQREWLSAPSLANRSDVIASLIDADVSFYNPDALPKVFEEEDEERWEGIEEAIEDVVGQYDEGGEEEDKDEDEDDDEDDRAF